MIWLYVTNAIPLPCDLKRSHALLGSNMARNRAAHNDKQEAEATIGASAFSCLELLSMPRKTHI